MIILRPREATFSTAPCRGTARRTSSTRCCSRSRSNALCSVEDARFGARAFVRKARRSRGPGGPSSWLRTIDQIRHNDGVSGVFDARVRITRLGNVVMSHQRQVPDLDYAHAEIAIFEALAAEIGRPVAMIMLLDRVLPPASAAVREVYRISAERTPIAVWTAVVGGVMGFAASIATSIAAQVFSRQTVPMRVFRTVPPAVEWMAQVTDLGVDLAEVLAEAERLRAPSPEIRQAG